MCGCDKTVISLFHLNETANLLATFRRLAFVGISRPCFADWHLLVSVGLISQIGICWHQQASFRRLAFVGISRPNFSQWLFLASLGHNLQTGYCWHHWATICRLVIVGIIGPQFADWLLLVSLGHILQTGYCWHHCCCLVNVHHCVTIRYLCKRGCIHYDII